MSAAAQLSHDLPRTDPDGRYWELAGELMPGLERVREDARPLLRDLRTLLEVTPEPAHPDQVLTYVPHQDVPGSRFGGWAWLHPPGECWACDSVRDPSRNPPGWDA